MTPRRGLNDQSEWLSHSLPLQAWLLYRLVFTGRGIRVLTLERPGSLWVVLTLTGVNVSPLRGYGLWVLNRMGWGTVVDHAHGRFQAVKFSLWFWACKRFLRLMLWKTLQNISGRLTILKWSWWLGWVVLDMAKLALVVVEWGGERGIFWHGSSKAKTTRQCATWSWALRATQSG